MALLAPLRICDAAGAEVPATRYDRLGDDRCYLLRPRLRGLDSGCVWGGHLSAWIAEEDRIVQVKAAKAYARFDE